MKKISIIIPVYKAEKYLDRCVESIVNQTYKNLEIILIDDGSPDNCPAMCDEWAKKDSRIKVIHKENAGPAEARNTGLDEATGDYIGFVDSDDYIDEAMYEKLIEKTKKNHADLAKCMYYQIYSNGKLKVVDEINLEKIDSNNIVAYYMTGYYNEKNDKITTTNIAPNIWSCLYKKELIGKTRFERFTIGEDFLFNCSVIKNDCKIATVCEPLYYYFINNEGIMHSQTEKKILEKIAFAERVFCQVENRVDEQVLYAYKFGSYREVVLSIISTGDMSIYDRLKNKLNNLLVNKKMAYKIYSKEKRSLKDKIINWLIYKNKIRTLMFLYKIKK